jgi:hypothetical protein
VIHHFAPKLAFESLIDEIGQTDGKIQGLAKRSGRSGIADISAILRALLQSKDALLRECDERFKIVSSWKPPIMRMIQSRFCVSGSEVMKWIGVSSTDKSRRRI